MDASITLAVLRQAKASIDRAIEGVERADTRNASLAVVDAQACLKIALDDFDSLRKHPRER